MDLKDIRNILLKSGACSDYAAALGRELTADDIFALGISFDAIDFMTAAKPIPFSDLKAVFSTQINRTYLDVASDTKAVILADFEGSFKVESGTSVISIMGRSICKLDLTNVYSCFINVADDSYVDIDSNSGLLYRIRVHDNAIVSLGDINSNIDILGIVFGDKASIIKRNITQEVNIKTRPRLTIKDIMN